MSAEKNLKEIAERAQKEFERARSVLSFDEYLALVEANPVRHTRDAGRYLRDCFLHYGTEQVEKAWGTERRFCLFDLPFVDQQERHRLVGHEALQNEFFHALEAFGHEGRANRLLLLHGPNGSAKSTFVACLGRALEDYSTQEEGALYHFSWVFPRGSDGRAIGFGSTERPDSGAGSYAHLPEESIELRIAMGQREHPLLLIPRDERRKLLAVWHEKADIHVSAPALLQDGELSANNRAIFDALNTAYRGDLSQVWNHIRVERWDISRRYRRGVVSIGPQMSVDAHERQVTADRSLMSIPPSLATLALYDVQGELVDGAGGIVEFSDLLKRPLEAWKYLLVASEAGSVSVGRSNLELNSVFVASSNELHLNAFRQHPEYLSFRGRMNDLAVPYLLSYRAEQEIYDGQIIPQITTHVAPHTTYVAALWAVLTRLRKTNGTDFAAAELDDVVESLTPLEKAELYADAKIPRRIEGDAAKRLLGALDSLRYHRDGDLFEGEGGASPRLMRDIMLDVGSYSNGCVGPLSVCERLETLCDESDRAFLRRDVKDGYYAHRAFVDVVRESWLDRVDVEFRASSGLVSDAQYLDVFERYMTHAAQKVKGEQILNEMTGKYDDPDEEMMREVEEQLGISKEKSEAFRYELLNQVGAWALDNPGESVAYDRLFPEYLDHMKNAFFEERRSLLSKLAIDLLAYIDDPSVTLDDRDTIDSMRRKLIDEYGYQDSSIQHAIGALLDRRYA